MDWVALTGFWVRVFLRVFCGYRSSIALRIEYTLHSTSFSSFHHWVHIHKRYFFHLFIGTHRATYSHGNTTQWTICTTTTITLNPTITFPYFSEMVYGIEHTSTKNEPYTITKSLIVYIHINYTTFSCAEGAMESSRTRMYNSQKFLMYIYNAKPWILTSEKWTTYQTRLLYQISTPFC